MFIQVFFGLPFTVTTRQALTLVNNDKCDDNFVLSWASLDFSSVIDRCVNVHNRDCIQMCLQTSGWGYRKLYSFLFERKERKVKTIVLLR